MFERRSIRRLLWLVLLACNLAQAEPGRDILVASDAIRNPPMPFSITVQLTEYQNKQVADEGLLTVYARMSPERGQFDTLVRINEPVRDSGKLMLKNGNEMWFFDPATKAGMRISPQQRLLGQASNGDVATVNLAADYKVVSNADETIADGNRRNTPSHRLRLQARSESVTYDAVDYWVEQGTNRPIKANFYAASGRLMKTAYYRRYESQLGRERPTETVIIDGVDPQLLTVMRYRDYRAADVPDSWFQRSGLSQVRP